MGGVAYLSLEDSEVGLRTFIYFPDMSYEGDLGTLCCRDQVSCHAANEAIPRHGATVRR